MSKFAEQDPDESEDETEEDPLVTYLFDVVEEQRQQVMSWPFSGGIPLTYNIISDLRAQVENCTGFRAKYTRRARCHCDKIARKRCRLEPTTAGCGTILLNYRGHVSS